MNKILLLGGLMMMGTSFVLAEDSAITVSMAMEQTQSGPCRQIREICQNAKYTKEGHASGSRGLYEDCVQPMMAGQSVYDIAVDQKFIDACRATLVKTPAAKPTNEATLASDTHTVN